MHKAVGYTVMLTLMTLTPVLAQGPEAEFGKNRIQYKQFDWSYYSTENFDLYFYQGGEELGQLAVSYLDQQYQRITDILGYVPLAKTKIFLYNSPTDLLQSNIGVSESVRSVAGQTEFVQNLAEVAYPGSMEAFKSELVYQVSLMLLQEMMYGGSLTDMFQNAYLLNLPDWYITGAARYIAYGWGPQMDDYIRELFHSQQSPKLDKFEGAQAGYVGQSIWHFVAEKYGRNNISSILNLTRIIRNEERSISNTLGITFNTFRMEWVRFYSDLNGRVLEAHQFPEESKQLISRNRQEVDYVQPRLSPNGRYLAFGENERGRYTVYLHDLERNKTKQIFQSGYRVLNQGYDQHLPLLAWQDSTTLAVAATRGGSPSVWLLKTESRERTRFDLGRFNSIQHLDFNYNGRLMVLSADENGQNDIYLVSLQRGAFRKLTSDTFDDLYPAFLPKENTIIFSSNRTSDSLSVVKSSNEQLLSAYRLYAYNLDTTSTVLAKITNSFAHDFRPVPRTDEEFYFLSDQKGIRNVYRYTLADSAYSQITSFAVGIQDFDVHWPSGTMAYIAKNFGADYVYLDDEIDLDNTIFTLPTPRQERIQAQYLLRRMERSRAQGTRQAPQETPPTETELLDPNNYQFEGESSTTGNGEVDTENYTFSPESIDAKQDRTQFLTDYRLNKQSQVLGPYDYDTRFRADKVVTSLLIDPLMGYGMMVETEMNDQLENHHFYLGGFSDFSADDSRVYMNYEYLKQKIDYQVGYFRKSLEIPLTTGSITVHQYILNEVETKASLPLSVSFRTEGGLFFSNTQYRNLDPTILVNPNPILGPVEGSQNYLGFRGALVFDNSVVSGLNQMQGTRAKAVLKHYQALGDATKTFGNFNIDLRHYQPIHRNFVFAARAFYGWFYGPQEQRYMLGGLDNWLFTQSFDSDTSPNPLAITDQQSDNSHILFTEFAMGMRGFPYNALNGRNVMQFNAELRLPIVQYLYNGPVSSSFFRNLQLIGFFDMGSAWTGAPPWNPNNQLNTRVISEEGSQFTIELRNFNNPWLMSYGTGLRTVFLRYYTKLDMAWVLNNYEIQDVQFALTLGYDF